MVLDVDVAFASLHSETPATENKVQEIGHVFLPDKASNEWQVIGKLLGEQWRWTDEFPISESINKPESQLAAVCDILGVRYADLEDQFIQDELERHLDVERKLAKKFWSGRSVQKFGVSTGLTKGRTNYPKYGMCIESTQVGRFAIPGDSGSLLVDESTHLVLGVISKLILDQIDSSDFQRRVTIQNQNLFVPIWEFLDAIQDHLQEASNESDMEAALNGD
jgi:hypothetical protein